jgi:tRNA-specific 2-thiouridylase
LPEGPDGRAYVIGVDSPGATVTVGPLTALLTSEIPVRDETWVVGEPTNTEALEVQMSAHGQTVPCRWTGAGMVATTVPVRRVAPGQSVVLYRGDAVVGGAIAR